jgi:hypothetical protein
VGWGIRGWATGATGGLNIEHVKDAFSDMLPTLVHETFHRLQTQIALADPAVDEAGFDRITSYPFEEAGDLRLYRALCYIMLEGSATYVAEQGSEQAWHEDAMAGLEILNRICEIDSSTDQEDAYDGLLNEGLKSNGPFYGFGALLSHAIVEAGGPSSLGSVLRRGAPAFTERGFRLLDHSSMAPKPKLASWIGRLRASTEDGTS